MIHKDKGKINELVYQQTMYNNGRNRFYPTLDTIEILINKIILLKTTTKYLRFNPFYLNSKLNTQLEYEDFMFYIECRESFTEEELKAHWTECMDNVYDVPHDRQQYDDMPDDKKRMARILYPLCIFGDVDTFNQHLETYKEYLSELIPMLFEDAIKRLNLSHSDLAFGYFCFEVHSG